MSKYFYSIHLVLLQKVLQQKSEIGNNCAFSLLAFIRKNRTDQRVLNYSDGLRLPEADVQNILPMR